MVNAPDRDRRIRLARRAIAVVAVLSAASAGLDLARLSTNHAWQHLAVLACTVGLIATCAVAIKQARAAPDRAIQLVYAALFVALSVVGCLIARPLGLLGCGAALFILVTAPRIFPPPRVDRWVYLATLGAIGLAALELLPLPTRIPGAVDGPRDILLIAALAGITVVVLREFSRYPLASKLTLGSLMITLAPLIAARIDSQRRLSEVDADLAFKDMSYRASRGATAWSGLLTRLGESVGPLAGDPALIAACVGDRARLGDAEQVLRALLAGSRDPALSAVAMWDRGGQPLLAVGAPLAGPPPHGFGVVPDASGADRIVGGLPVHGASGPCTVAVAVRPGLLRDWTAAAATEVRAGIVFRDDAGHVLFSTAAPDLADALPGVPAAEPERTGDGGLPDLPLAPSRDVLTERLAGGRGLVAVARIAGPAKWSLALAHDEAALLAVADAHARRMQWITLLVAALACLGAFLLSRRIARPIAQLAAAMTRFTEGHTDARAPVAGADEIGELARRFDQMAEQVGGLVRSLEQQTKRLQTEISERSDQEQRLQSLNSELTVAHDKAQAASRAKSTFLAHMSHELRTPLNAIIGYGEMLFDQASADGRLEVARDAGNIVQSAQHLLEIINDILDLSKIEAGKMDMVLEEFDAAKLAREVGESVRPIIAGNKNHLYVRIEQEPAKMYSDRLKLRQAILNLLSNAAKFTEGGEVVLSVEHRQVNALACLVFTVRDTGIGIPEDALHTLFDPFTQVAYPAVRKQSGTGLGLAITRRLCRLMGGEIEVSSAVGRGSTFTMTVPATYKGNRESGSWRPLRVFRKLEETGRGKFF